MSAGDHRRKRRPVERCTACTGGPRLPPPPVPPPASVREAMFLVLAAAGVTLIVLSLLTGGLLAYVALAG